MGRVSKFTVLGISALLSILFVLPSLAMTLNYRECQAYATDVADQAIDPAKDIATGALAGLVGGSIAGELINGRQGAYTGAAIGVGAGALAGVVSSSSDWDYIYYAAYNDCRNGFPDDETPANFTGAPPWSERWIDYCKAKYRSFNHETGYYTTYGGAQKFCVYQGSGLN